MVLHKNNNYIIIKSLHFNLIEFDKILRCLCVYTYNYTYLINTIFSGGIFITKCIFHVLFQPSGYSFCNFTLQLINKYLVYKYNRLVIFPQIWIPPPPHTLNQYKIYLCIIRHCAQYIHRPRIITCIMYNIIMIYTIPSVLPWAGYCIVQMYNTFLITSYAYKIAVLGF